MPCVGSEPDCNLCAQISSLGIPSKADNPSNRTFRLSLQVFVVSFSVRSHLWPHGPYSLFSAFPAMLSQTRHEQWVRVVNRVQASVTSWREADIIRLKNKVNERRAKEAKREGRTISPNVPMVWSWPALYQWFDDPTVVSEGVKQQQRLRGPAKIRQGSNTTCLGRIRHGAGLAIRVPRCQQAIIALVLAAIQILGTERVVGLNLTDAGEKWGYGQIFALLTTLPALVDTFKLFSRLGRYSGYVLSFTAALILMRITTNGCC